MLLSALQGEGSGVMSGAHNENVSADNGYAVSRDLTVLAKFGYQSIHYGGIPPYNFTGPLWNLGLRWVPNPDSSIELRYGQQQGVSSPVVNATYAPTARTRLYARYSEGLSTNDQDLAAAVSASTLDPLGNPVDRQTGAPLLLASNTFGLQNNLARIKRASLTGTLLYLAGFAVAVAVVPAAGAARRRPTRPIPATSPTAACSARSTGSTSSARR